LYEISDMLDDFEADNNLVWTRSDTSLFPAPMERLSKKTELSSGLGKTLLPAQPPCSMNVDGAGGRSWGTWSRSSCILHNIWGNLLRKKKEESMGNKMTPFESKSMCRTALSPAMSSLCAALFWILPEFCQSHWGRAKNKNKNEIQILVLESSQLVGSVCINSTLVFKFSRTWI
jgi:hypothetical protein